MKGIVHASKPLSVCNIQSFKRCTENEDVFTRCEDASEYSFQMGLGVLGV